MNKQEKLNAILERVKAKCVEFDGDHISAMVICGYLADMDKLGLIESAYAISPSGELVRHICDEFDWKPDDGEVLGFVKEMVEPHEQAAFFYLIKKYRDDREGLIQEFTNSKKASGDESPLP